MGWTGENKKVYLCMPQLFFEQYFMSGQPIAVFQQGNLVIFSSAHASSHHLNQWNFLPAVFLKSKKYCWIVYRSLRIVSSSTNGKTNKPSVFLCLLFINVRNESVILFQKINYQIASTLKISLAKNAAPVIAKFTWILHALSLWNTNLVSPLWDTFESITNEPKVSFYNTSRNVVLEIETE